jgi:hypothetical protein
MHNTDMNNHAVPLRRPARLPAGRAAISAVAAMALAALLAGCSGFATFIGTSEPEDELPAVPAPAIADVEPGSEGLGIYLSAMLALSGDDMVAQEVAYHDAAIALSTAPTTTNRLRMALIHAVPGHPWSDARQARAELQALLTQDNTLLPAERTLAGIYLQHAEQTLMLREESERLRSVGAEALQEQQAASARELDAVRDENRRLREELEDALERLDAIANIERSIRERENGSDSP